MIHSRMYLSKITWIVYTQNNNKKDFELYKEDECVLREVTQVKKITCDSSIPLKHAEVVWVIQHVKEYMAHI